jgi:hypothetical protein
MAKVELREYPKNQVAKQSHKSLRCDYDTASYVSIKYPDEKKCMNDITLLSIREVFIKISSLMKKTLAINLMKNRFTKIEHLVWADIWYLRKAPPRGVPYPPLLFLRLIPKALTN